MVPGGINLTTTYYQGMTAVGGITAVLEWSKEISKYASFLNVIRLQGIPDWYDNPLHPYSEIMLKNAVFIFASFAIPTVVFSSLFIRKSLPNQKTVLFFTILALAGLLFTAGSHPPFGFIY